MDALTKNSNARRTVTTDSNVNRSCDQLAWNNESGAINDTKSRAVDVNSDKTNNNASSRSSSGKKDPKV